MIRLVSPRPGRWRTGAAVLAGLLLLPAIAAAIDCPVPLLPRPQEDAATIRGRLEAQRLWHRSGDPALSPPADPQLGDTWLWYVWDLGGFPVANLKPATVRGLGDNVYVVVDDDEWNVSIDQADVDRIVNHFDNVSLGDFPDQGIWDLNTSHFGDPPNPLDGLDRIFLFYYRFDIAADGFFWAYDQFPDGSQPFASNECDVVYLATDSGQPASDYMLAVAAHEFEHMIHYARDDNEAAWLDEGLGELAMWLFGNPDVISSFNSNPDNPLLDWGGAWADYIQCYLWSLYCYEQFGGQPLIWDLIHDPVNSMASWRNAINGQGYMVQTEDVFDDWAVANFVDDPTVPDGQYGYTGDDLPPFNAWRTHATYPVNGSGSVQPHAADYVRLQDFTGAVTVTFDGADTREWRVSLIALDPVLPTLVTELPLDDAGAGTLTFSAAAGYEQVVMSVANVHLSGSGVYLYTVEEGAVAAPATPIPTTPVLASHPNPFNPRTEVRFSLPADGRARVRIYATDGRLVRTLVDGDLTAGAHAVPWLGRDDAGRGVPSGTYLMRLETARGTAVHKVMLVR